MASARPAPIAPTACTPRSRPVSPDPPCSRRATNTMNSTRKIPCAMSAKNASARAARTGRWRRTARKRVAGRRAVAAGRSAGRRRGACRSGLPGRRAAARSARPRSRSWRRRRTTIARRSPAASSRPPSGPPTSRATPSFSATSELADTSRSAATSVGSSAFLARIEQRRQDGLRDDHRVDESRAHGGRGRAAAAAARPPAARSRRASGGGGRSGRRAVRPPATSPIDGPSWARNASEVPSAEPVSRYTTIGSAMNSSQSPASETRPASHSERNAGWLSGAGVATAPPCAGRRTR